MSSREQNKSFLSTLMGGGINSKLPLLILFMLSLAVSAAATHTSTAELSPEWSPAGQNVNYTVTFTNNGPDAVGEVRIYNNDNYTDFICNPKVGWILSEPAPGICNYYAYPQATNKIPSGGSASFTFSATTPASGCQWVWQFETRDVTFPNTGSIQYLSDTTSVDDSDPTIEKTVTGSQSGDCPPGSGEECWVTTSTTIGMTVTDQGAECGISGLDSCEVTYTIDGGSVIVKTFVLNGETSWSYDMTFGEDSNHALKVECKDRAGNELIDEEVFIVDSTSPVTTKHFEGPQKIFEGVEWIDGVTKVVLEATDSIGLHDVNIDKTLYLNVLVEDLNVLVEDYQLGEEPCRNPQEFCKPMFHSPPTECVLAAETLCNYNPQDSQSVACVEAYIAQKCLVGQAPFQWKVYTGPFQKEEESCHILEYYSIDKLGNTEDVKVNCFFVDKTPPEVEKDVGEPKVEELDLERIGNGESAWVTSQASTGNASAKLVIPDGAGSGDFAGVDSFFDVFVELSSINSLTYDQKVVQFDKGWSPLVILGIDADNDGKFEAQPLEWEAGAIPRNPAILGDDSFIQCEIETELVSLDLVSFNPIDVYNNFKCYIPTADGTNWGGTYQPLSYYQNNNVEKIETTDEVAMVKVMLGGNPSTQDNEIAYVDNVRLNGVAIIDEPDGLTWVTPETDITFTCDDPEPHPSGDEELCYRVSFDDVEGQWGYITEDYCSQEDLENGWCCVDAAKPVLFNFNINEDSMHDLEYYCKDAVEKKSDTYIQYYKVDSTPPYLVNKWINGPSYAVQGDCPPNDESDICHLDGESTIYIEAKDGGDVHPIGGVWCQWGYYLDDTTPFYGWYSAFPIHFPEETKHDLVIECYDALGNKMVDNETFYVDKTPPKTTKIYIGPQYPVEGYPKWITSSTKIELTATDSIGKHDSGVKATYWRNTLVTDQYCWNQDLCQQAVGTGEFNPYNGPFYKEGESCHLIEYYSVDNVGKTEQIKKQCVFVENTDPTVWKVVGKPNVEKGDDIYITKTTPIDLFCEDRGNHPVDHVSLKYRYRVSNDCATLDSNQNWTNWLDPNGNIVQKTIYFPEDSCHELEYYCEDALGNKTETFREIDVVDTKPPVITKEIVGPKSGDCPPRPGTDDKCYIDGRTTINVTATDPEPHPVDQVTCQWWYTLDDIDQIFGPFNTFPIQFLEETRHNLTIECKDALGNTTTDTEVFYVDKTPPAITKTYSGPQYPAGIDDETPYPHWITSETAINVAVEDVGPHLSGIKSVEYRITLLGSDAPCNSKSVCQEQTGSGSWTAMQQGQATIPPIGEQSCHLIEVFAKDNVDKNSTLKQCVFVDNNAPTPLKTVGEPRDEWTPGENGDSNSIFYPEETSHCWDDTGNEIECWEVTILTPVSLECNDPEPHPVDHENVCFNVEVDGEDATQDYCSVVQGDYNANGDNYCCLEGTTDQFYFLEETEHNLKYYCEDALENKGPIDEEKFKVEGTAFKIQLNKKWNLVSVPFVLINDDPEDVFNGIEGDVESVWTYDAFTDEWYVYHPGDEDTSNLDEIIPGWGYWVAMYDANTLVLGGSLFSPITTPPSKPVKHGWNLIGYYGADGETEYDGPDGYGNPARCVLYSLGESLLDKGWTSLFTYWEPFNPNPWVPYDYWNNMDPGAGYWISASEDSLYEYTTTCGGGFP